MTFAQRRVAFAIFAVAWGTNISTPLILRYQDRLALSDSGAVAIFSVYVGGILLALLFAGRASDRWGRRPIVVPFTLLSGVGSLIMLVGRDALGVLFLGRFLLGLVSGATLSVATAWINELSTARPRDAGDSAEGAAADAAAAGAARLRLAGTLTVLLYAGFGFGPIFSALWERWLPEPLVWPYAIHAAACALSGFALLGVGDTKRRDATVSLRPQLGVPAGARRDFVRVLIPAGVWVFGYPSVSFALLPVVLSDAIGASAVLVSGLTGSITATAVLLARPVLARVGAPRPALAVGAVVGVVGYTIGAIAFIADLWWLAPVAAVLLGTASGILMSAGLAITEALSDDANRGALSATFYLVAYSGMAMPLLLTGVGAVTSTATALVGVTIVAAIVTLWIASAVWNHDRERPLSTLRS